jgi:hypothetical protein
LSKALAETLGMSLRAELVAEEEELAVILQSANKSSEPQKRSNGDGEEPPFRREVQGDLRGE